MGGRHEPLPSPYGYQVRVLMDCWDKLFLDDPSLDPPGSEEEAKDVGKRAIVGQRVKRGAEGSEGVPQAEGKREVMCQLRQVSQRC